MNDLKILLQFIADGNGTIISSGQAKGILDGIKQLEQERDQLKEDNTLMKLFLEDLVKWNSHGYVGAKEILDNLRQKAQVTK